MKTLNKFVNSQFLRSLICVCLFCIPLTSSAQPMRGAYTIDPAGSGPRNFISFTTALQALGPAGIDSAIVFNVADGDYYEMLQIGSISGASAVNTITFQGDENDSTKVRLWMETNDYRFPFTMHFNSYASHYIFRKMTIEGTGSYANVILTDQAGYLKGNVIENCLLKGKQTSSTSVDYAIYYDRGEQTLTENAFITFRNNLFVDGSYGIFSYSRTSEARLENFEITGNQFINQSKAGIFLNNCPEATINNNYFYLIRENVHGICLENCDKDISIQGNTIIITKGGLPGLVLRDCDGNVLDKGLIANNFITVDGTLTGYGIQLDTSTYQMIFHNSINIINTNAGSAALLGNGGDHNEVRNNIFSNTGGGYAYFLMTTSAVSSSDYNNYFSNWNTLARWGIIDQPTLDDLRTANNDDAHSVSVNPGFYSSDDLHTNAYWLDGMGDPGTGITTDIDGETRSSPPDIGADEFTSTTLPLAGTYKIGGSSPHYAKIKDAFDDLQAKGVMGPTTFEIRDENYNEHIGWVYEIPGADENDTIVFKSESGNPENVILHYSTDIFDRIIIGLNGIDHLTIQDISIAVTGEAYGLALYSRGNCENINILNNHLASANTADNVVQITEGIKHDIVIENNTFSKGLHSLVFGGLENNLVTNSIVSNNIFSGAEIQAIEIFYHHSPSIMNNTITNKELATGEPILVYNCEGNLKISGNIIINALGDFGIKLDNCIAISPFTGLVANNMIQVGDNLTAYGILVENSKRMNLYHNTVNITSSDTVNGRAIYIHDNNEEINLVNNIIANSGGGYALFVNDPTDIILSDYNGLYSSGTNFLSWGGTDYFSLDSMIAASGMDDHSLSVDPKFVSETDLHSRQFSFMGAATPLEEVKYDIVNHPRDALNPDIGAIEFWCETPDFNIFVSTACYGDTTLFIDNSSNITEGASYEWDFDGNFSPEIYSDIPNDTLMYHYDTSGVYTLVFIVHQLEGCDDWTSVPVRVVALPVLDITAEGAYCDNNDGQATVSIIDGGGTYTYYWSTGSTDSIVRDLALGTYTVAVSDSNGCTSNGEITIEEAIRVEVTELQSSTCGKSDGIAEVSVSGGIEPYEIVWSSGGTSAVDSFLAPGLHYVNVIDANECYARGSVVIGNDGSGPEIKLESKMDNLCFGDMMGFIDISISGGETPYDILWSNGSRTEDLENLAAGIYDVVIVDNDTCSTTGSFTIKQPQKITIGSVVENATCLGNDGQAAVMVSGGTEPYQYSWSTGGYLPVEDELSSGIYSVTITDENGCEETKPIIVNSIDGPVVSLFSISGVTCTDTLGGSIEISTSGGTPLYHWLWTPGGYTKPKIDSLSMGIYEVEVTDETGCTGYNFFEVKEEPPTVNPICLVTVDTLTQMNMVVWEKLNPDHTAYYKIWRESSQKGEYNVIGTSHPDSAGIFIDSVADPSIRSWRYRLSVVDKCGNESELSDPHKTMHLTMNVGIDENVNLIWDHYQGFPFSTYNIWRYDASGGWILLDSIPSNLTSYTDFDPPWADLTYYIEVDHPSGCDITGKKAGTLNSSRSNRKTRLKKSTEPDGTGNIIGRGNFNIYPNPSPGIFNLSMELSKMDHVEIKVFDVTGKPVIDRKYNNVPYSLDTQLDLSGFAPGVYQVRVKTSNMLGHRVLILE